MQELESLDEILSYKYIFVSMHTSEALIKWKHQIINEKKGEISAPLIFYL